MYRCILFAPCASYSLGPRMAQVPPGLSSLAFRHPSKKSSSDFRAQRKSHCHPKAECSQTLGARGFYRRANLLKEHEFCTYLGFRLGNPARLLPCPVHSAGPLQFIHGVVGSDSGSVASSSPPCTSCKCTPMHFSA